jgi:hypothetical protein
VISATRAQGKSEPPCPPTTSTSVVSPRPTTRRRANSLSRQSSSRSSTSRAREDRARQRLLRPLTLLEEMGVLEPPSPNVAFARRPRYPRTADMAIKRSTPIRKSRSMFQEQTTRRGYETGTSARARAGTRDGKEGVDGSSPSEGLYKSPANGYLVLPVMARLGLFAGTKRVHFGTGGHARAHATSRDTAWNVLEMLDPDHLLRKLLQTGDLRCPSWRDADRLPR